MNLEKSLDKVVGQWHGTNLMRLTPDQEFGASDSLATVSVLAHGGAATITYTWADKGKPQDGVLLMTNGPKAGSVAAVWIDSWHQHPQWMELKGKIDSKGMIQLQATYMAEDVECGWRISLDGHDPKQLRLTMDNIYGDMDYHAVEAKYSR